MDPRLLTTKMRQWSTEHGYIVIGQHSPHLLGNLAFFLWNIRGILTRRQTVAAGQPTRSAFKDWSTRTD